MGTVVFAKLLLPLIFHGNDIPEKNLIKKIVGNFTTAIFS